MVSRLQLLKAILVAALGSSLMLPMTGCQSGLPYVDPRPEIGPDLPGEVIGGPVDVSAYQPTTLRGRTPAVYGPKVKFGHIGGEVR